MVKRRTAFYYRDPHSRREPAREWLESLKDKMGQGAIYVRIARAESGNFGDHRPVGNGVVELRVSVGPGYRVYFALDGEDVILLLVGGSKSTQSKDIAIAKIYWAAHKAGRRE